MSRWEAWSFGALNLVLALTGGVYFHMKYMLGNEDPFAVVNHPWQPAVLAAHVLAAPLGLVVFGVVLRSHVLGKLAVNGRSGRRTGWISLIGFSAMALSGYLLQVVASPTGLRVVRVTHVLTSAVFVLGYTAHLIRDRVAVRARGFDRVPGTAESGPHVP